MARLQLLALATALLAAHAVCVAAGDRQMLRSANVAGAPSGMMAGAPGPSAGKPAADILFTITASRAVLAADTLTLTGVAPVALHVTSGQGAGTTPVGDFANSSTGALYVNGGQWLADPVAVLEGTADGAPAKALVQLSSPKLNVDKTTLIFQARILPADSDASLPTAGGVTARLVDAKANGLANNLLTSASSAPLTNVGLFIDVNSEALGQQAQTKFLGWLLWGPHWGWGPGWWGGPGWGGGHGWGGYGWDGYGWGKK